MTYPEKILLGAAGAAIVGALLTIIFGPQPWIVLSIAGLAAGLAIGRLLR